MGWHIHMKDNKFNIWSTVLDDYIIDQWVSEDYVRSVYVECLVNEAEDKIKADAVEMIKNAKEGFCGLSYSRCNPKVIDQILKSKLLK